MPRAGCSQNKVLQSSQRGSCHRNHSHPFILETMETDSEIQESCQGRMGWSKGDGACTEDEERIERDVSELVRQAAPKAAGRRTHVGWKE